MRIVGQLTPKRFLSTIHIDLAHAIVEVEWGTTPLSWCYKRAIHGEEVLAIEVVELGAPLPLSRCNSSRRAIQAYAIWVLELDPINGVVWAARLL